MRVTPTHLLQLWHNTWTTHTPTLYTSSMTDNMSTHRINKDYFSYINIKSKVLFPYHLTVHSGLTMSISPLLQYYTQVNISEWCKGRKRGGHLQPWLQHKMGAVPHFNPSLPQFLSPSFLISTPGFTPLLLNIISDSIRLPPFLILPTNLPRPTPCIPLPCK